MKNILIFTTLLLSFHTFAQEGEDLPESTLSAEILKSTKLWCIVYFKERPNSKLILEAESVGSIDRKSENFLTLKGKILDSREYSDINLYIVRASACTSDLEFAKKTRDERNSVANAEDSKKVDPKTAKSKEKDSPGVEAFKSIMNGSKPTKSAKDKSPKAVSNKTEIKKDEPVSSNGITNFQKIEDPGLSFEN